MNDPESQRDSVEEAIDVSSEIDASWSRSSTGELDREHAQRLAAADARPAAPQPAGRASPWPIIGLVLVLLAVGAWGWSLAHGDDPPAADASTP